MKRLPIIFLAVIFACMLFVGATEYCAGRPTKSEAIAIDAKTIPDGQNVWYIGDSYSDNDYVRSKIQETFGDILVNAQSARRFTRDLPGIPSGTTVVRQYVATGIKPTYLIYELDTNDHDLTTLQAANEIKELREIVGPDTYIILMTAHSYAYDNAHYNSAVWRAAEEDDHILVADWQGAIIGQEQKYISADRLHPNQAGHNLMIKLFKEQLDLAVKMAQD